MYAYNATIDVLVNDRPVKKHFHNGMTFIESRKGTKYSIKIRNNRHQRIMAIISVDGLDVISGKSAQSADTGYVINGNDFVEIKGYRINDNEVAEFVFSEKNKSYTKSVTGSAKNAGVIGVRIYEEKIAYSSGIGIVDSLITETVSPNWTYTTSGTTPIMFGDTLVNAPTYGGTSINSSTLAANSVQTSTLSRTYSTVASFDHGTTWGKKQIDSVVKTSFTCGNLLREEVIYYSSRNSLEEMGISFKKQKQIASATMPSAFGETRYCKPPDGWNG